MSEPKFKFQLGDVCETQDGRRVQVIGRVQPAPGYECVKCSDGMHRYDRNGDPSDAGRVTGTDHDYSYPGNFKRTDKKPNAEVTGQPRTGEPRT